MLENPQDEDKVFNNLKSSYDVLKHTEKEIFLDIACFFIGCERENAEHVWRARRFYPKEALRVLQHRSLLKFDEKNEFQMHDLIRDMGRRIVADENREEPQMRSRLWEMKALEEALECPYLGSPMEANNVKGIVLHKGRYDRCLTTESFQKMDNLRLLVVGNQTLFQGECKDLPRKLKWLKWKGGSDSDFLPSGFPCGNIVVLDLSQSRLTRLWSQPPSGRKLQELKVLNLSRCEDLLATPDFSWVPSLKKLILDGCHKLVEVHPSIGQLRNSLEYLSMQSCRSVKELPDSVTVLISLQYLDLSLCGMISALPNCLGDLSSLESLNVRGCCRLESIPSSIGHLKNLRELGLNHTMIQVLPDSVGSLEKLVTLSLDQCRNLQYFPISVTWTNLELLEIGHSSIKELSQNMLGSLTSLKKLHLAGNKDLRSLHWRMETLSQLRELHVMDSDHLESVAGIPSSVIGVTVIRCRSLVNINNISNCTALEELQLDGCCSLQEIPALENSNRLQRLSLNDCRALRSVSQFPPSLRYLSMRDCTSLVGISNLSNLECLEELYLYGCGMLADVPGLPKALKRLDLRGCAMEILEGIESLESLEYLWVATCRRLSRIDRLPPSLQRLLALHCPALKTVDVSNSKSLYYLDVSECTKLVDIGGIEKLNGIQFLRFRGCKNLSGDLAHRIVKKMNMERLTDFSIPASVRWQEGRTELSFAHPNFFFSGKDRYLDVMIWIQEISEDESSNDDQCHIPDVDCYSEVLIRIQVLMDGTSIFQDTATSWRDPPVNALIFQNCYPFQRRPTKNDKALVLVSLDRRFKLEADIHCPARDYSRIIVTILRNKATT